MSEAKHMTCFASGKRRGKKRREVHGPFDPNPGMTLSPYIGIAYRLRSSLRKKIHRYAGSKKRGKFLGNHGATQIIALPFGAMTIVQIGKLFLRFDSFRNDAVAEIFPQANDVVNQDIVVIFGCDAGHE